MRRAIYENGLLLIGSMYFVTFVDCKQNALTQNSRSSGRSSNSNREKKFIIARKLLSLTEKCEEKVFSACSEEDMTL